MRLLLFGLWRAQGANTQSLRHFYCAELQTGINTVALVTNAALQVCKFALFRP